MMRALLLLLFISFGSSALALQFDLKQAGFGTYIRGEYGLMIRGDASYADSSGALVTFDGTRTSEAGGEFGVLWSGTKTVFRASTAVLLPKRLSSITGGVNGTPYFEMDSKATVILPQANLDIIVKPFASSRILVSFGGGYAYVTTTNAYKMTAAGTAAYPGVVDHTETGKGSGLDLQTSIAYETEFADHATLVLDLGYRYLRINALTSSGAVKTFTGTYAEGDTLKNNDGSDRSLDLGGFFGGAGFRFYF